jgi:hypothetical protein
MISSSRRLEGGSKFKVPGSKLEGNGKDRLTPSRKARPSLLFKDKEPCLSLRLCVSRLFVVHSWKQRQRPPHAKPQSTTFS